MMARKRGDRPALPTTVKLTVRLPVELVQRLGVEAAMTRRSQSAIVAAVLGPHLQRWRLPSTVNDPVGGAGREEPAA